LSSKVVLMGIKITILSENSVLAPEKLIGEHGFSALVERGKEKVLFDTGQGFALTHNADALGIDLADIKKVVLSHGHKDHTGGLVRFLESGGPKDVYAHPGIFVSRYRELNDSAKLQIGIPFTRSHLEDLGARLHLEEGPQEVAGGFYTTGVVERETPFEKGDTALFLSPEDGGGSDIHIDDLSLVVEGDDGIVVLLGCAHAGMVNILRHVQKMFPEREIKSVLGGTHLGFSSEEQMAGTIEALADMGIEKVGASHCTGLVGAARLMEALGDGFFFAGVGTILEL